MALKDTIKTMKGLLCEITGDLDKAEGGNKAASQRVRTGTIKLEKTAKMYRKESINAEKSGSFKKKPKAAKKAAPAKKAKPQPKPVAKKKPTAKIPTRR